MKSSHLLIACFGSAGAVVLAALATGHSSATAAPPPVVAIATAAPAQSGFGTIKGRLVWGGTDVPKVAALVTKGDQTKKDPQVCATKTIPSRELVVDPATKGIAYGFAYVNNPKGKNADAEKALVAKAATVEIDQKNCEFVPYATALHQGQKVVFKSSDPVVHNVRYTGFSPSNAGNIALPPNGQTQVSLAMERRPLALACDIHPWMKGYMMVFSHPFFAVTGEDGSFEITGVPAGTQNLVVWQEKVGYVTPKAATGQAVTVQAGQVTDVGDITLDPAKIKK